MELAHSNERLRLAMETGRSVGWEWDIGSGRNLWFGDLRSLFGMPSDSITTQADDFYEYVHPEDQRRVSEEVANAKRNHSPFTEEFRIVLPDGTTRWIVSRGRFEYARNGDATRMLGMAVDITERKQAEEALSDVNRRLVKAQEEERTRIARELHDDINQRIALLVVNLGRMKQDLPTLRDKASRAITEVCEHMREIGHDIQALSHRLHSSKLEYLGLEVAAAGFCKELSVQHNVEVDFHSEGIPKTLPKEISVCLFRVLQEALQNAVKHSGSKHFEVSLNGATNEVKLSVRDSGIGFDPETALSGRGLGLISMKERLKFVDGQLSIDSKLQQGTTIHAHVPLRTSVKSAATIG